MKNPALDVISSIMNLFRKEDIDLTQEVSEYLDNRPEAQQYRTKVSEPVIKPEIIESDVLNINKNDLFTSGLKDIWGSSSGNLENYIKENAETTGDFELLRHYAGLIGSDPATAVGAEIGMGFTNLNELFSGNRGEYKGQNLNWVGGMFRESLTEDEIEQYLSKNNIENSPDLLSIFLGQDNDGNPVTAESEGLIKHDKRPAGFEYKPGEVYDIEKYMTIDDLNIVDYNNKIKKLKSGEVKAFPLIDADYNLSLDYDDNEIDELDYVKFNSSIDLGESKMSLGWDSESQRPFISLADIWDFEGSTGIQGNLLEYIGKNPINVYGRFYLDE